MSLSAAQRSLRTVSRRNGNRATATAPALDAPGPAQLSRLAQAVPLAAARDTPVQSPTRLTVVAQLRGVAPSILLPGRSHAAQLFR